MGLESLSTWNVQFILVREALVRDPTAQAVAALFGFEGLG
jgi:hypothetical protein